MYSKNGKSYTAKLWVDQKIVKFILITENVYSIKMPNVLTNYKKKY